ncbi:uncharacterized protein N7479_009564 [Penicillium vulpinum]|uniref:Uncharacterized protein n=1 Tax=Penicillium vulpinum TaxID=29845 RepID=A0A1V6RYL0_9EURO|nr:uncharacterized protein N7479_009564 [Penicillium vulpinum]KAJ5951151.1 hypothetical protein N7479_009564 [Penicillium vulpinum]OQE06867.1 hypothetical protein PENVUL_c016G01718 [Penicillium vulpinum]
MPTGRKQSVNNGFVTEREVGGERRSIRHYHDGRVSGPTRPVAAPIPVLSRKASTLDLSDAKDAPNPKGKSNIIAVPELKDLKCDPETAAEIVDYCGELGNVPQKLPEVCLPTDVKTISKQWEQMGGKDHTGNSDLHK